MTRSKKPSTVSILNWMGTLLLCSIPGVNLITIICTLIFAKSPSKKNFAWAMLILALIAVVFPNQTAELANLLRDAAAQTPATVTP